MAQKVNIVLVDDLDGTEATETVTFGLDGSTYDGASLPGPCPFNCTNGEDVGSSSFPHPYYGSEGTAEAYAFHPGVANFALGDASVRSLNQEINIRVFARLITRANREIVTLPSQ